MRKQDSLGAGATFLVLLLFGAMPLLATSGPTLSDESDARALEGVLAAEKNFFDAIANDPETRRRSHEENEKRVLEIGRRYEELARRRVDDASVMILYGKFLRRIDDRAKADHWFRQAARLAPRLALPKHQLGVYAAEEGDFARAYELLKEAVALEPSTAVYHFHLGEFLSIWRDHLEKAGLCPREKCEEEMVQAFREAAKRKPGETVYLWRYGESLGDCQKPDWPAALVVWKMLETNLKNDLDREAIVLQRARAHIGLGWLKDAENELAQSKSPRLAASRDHLRTLLDAAKKEKKEAGGEAAEKTSPAADAPAPGAKGGAR
ncbi:MAG: hypothetical protein LBG65_06460 [Puniceicoccales bacterium]|jgi:tetratricopeptide (TPR) repeat protein|nr:hypothetical protein [Puniceicoccales bacterium]